MADSPETNTASTSPEAWTSLDESQQNDQDNHQGTRDGSSDIASDDDQQDYSFIKTNEAATYPEEHDYYSLLNLPRGPPPSDAQIRAAFKTLTLSFHPDKQPPELREAAAEQYDRIRTAYETLSDPQKKTVYDMLGEEGVRAEWGVGGSMGRGGDAEKTGMAVGVRAMDERQFKRWFLDTMRKRERKAVEELVNARGSIKLSLDASSMVALDEEGIPTLQVPDVKLTSYALSYNFQTPFSPLKWFSKGSSKKDAAVSTWHGAQPEKESEEQEDMLEFKAGINGKLHELRKSFTLVDEETGREFEKEIKMGNALIAEGFTLSATWRHLFGDIPKKQGRNAATRLGLSLLENSVLETSTDIFPYPALNTSITKAIAPVPNARPFTVNLKTRTTRSPLECPPTLSLQIQRQLGARGVSYLNWSSGPIFWPDFILNMLTSPSGDDAPIFVSHETSHIELGYTVVPPNKEFLIERDPASNRMSDDVADHEARELAWERARCDPRPTWGVVVLSSPAVPLALSLNYARTVFARPFEAGVDERVLSQWTGEGYRPNRPQGPEEIVAGSGVRVEVSSMIRAEDLAVGWWMDATRRVTEFSKVGLGVGVQAGTGLSMHVVWKRLGQRIRVPIALVPADNVTFNLCVFAAAVPWGLYSIYEYAVRRPRMRKQRLRHVKQERRRLASLVAEKKEESQRAVEMMRDQVKRRQEREEERNGLVILSAEYGCPTGSSRREEGDEKESLMIDVTTAVGALVEQGQLNISAKVMKWQLIGFWDPAPLRSKVLRVRYKFKGEEHFVEVKDSEPLSCPMRAHLVL